MEKIDIANVVKVENICRLVILYVLLMCVAALCLNAFKTVGVVKLYISKTGFYHLFIVNGGTGMYPL